VTTQLPDGPERPIEGLPGAASRYPDHCTSGEGAALSAKSQIVTRLPLAVIFLCTAIVVMLWAVLIYDVNRSRTTAMDEARRDLTNLAIASRENVAGTVSAIDQLLIAIAAAHATHPGQYRIPEWIGRSPLMRGLLFQITLIAPDGIIRGSSMGGEGQDMSDRPHFRHHLDPSASQPFISVPLLGRVSRKWSVQFTRRLTDADGRFDGVVVISLDPFHLSQFFESLNLGENGSAILAGSDGSSVPAGGSTTSSAVRISGTPRCSIICAPPRPAPL
jgi:hypothetical protein